MSAGNFIAQSRVPRIPPTLTGVYTDGLVARWLLDGSLTDQVSGRVLTRAGTWNTTSYNMVWDIELKQYVPVFTGTNYYTFNPAAHDTHVAFPSGASSGSISCWAKWRATETTSPVAYGADSSLQSRGIRHAGGVLRSWYGGSGLLSGISSLSDGTWHHCVFSYNGTTLSVLVDGVLQGTSTVTLSTGLTVGEISYNTGTANMVGFVADVRIWNTSLPVGVCEILATGKG